MVAKVYTSAQTHSRKNGTMDLVSLIIVLLFAATALILASGLRVSGGVNSGHLGWMSAQWLAEYRAAQRTQ